MKPMKTQHSVGASRAANDTQTLRLPRPTLKAHKVKGVRVELVSMSEGIARRAQTVTGVRSLRTGRILWALVSVDLRGAELAMLAAERYCFERGYVLVMRGSERHADKRKAA